MDEASCALVVLFSLDIHSHDVTLFGQSIIIIDRQQFLLLVLMDNVLQSLSSDEEFLSYS